MDRIDEYIKKVNNSKKIIKNIYLKNKFDWLVGYSGGKDSSVLTQIIIEALEEIDKTKLKNKIHIVSSDTLIENPIVLKQLNESLQLLKKYVLRKKLPISIHLVKPDIDESFWVNLIGRGYPLPNQSFRWCTDRLKIKPMNKYLEEIKLSSNKEILTVLGVRKGESSSRDIKLNNSKIEDSHLRINQTNSGYIFAPIEEFGLYDIWKYLADSQLGKEFKSNNDKLSILYEDSSYGVGECPSSLDDKLAKGCGNSRWGCWLCPVVTKDKSLEGFINSGQEWLKPLLDFREELMNGRDKIVNRYNASFRINKKTNKANLIKFRYIDLSYKNGTYFLPKKDGREKFVLGEVNSNQKFLVNDKKQKFKIISQSDYQKKVEKMIINPYDEKNNDFYHFVIKLDKNIDNHKLSIPGFGPYTLKYRKSILKKLIKLSKDVDGNLIEIITEDEIKKIKQLFLVVEEALRENDYLNWENSNEVKLCQKVEDKYKEQIENI